MRANESRPGVNRAAVNEDLQSAPVGNDSHFTPDHQQITSQTAAEDVEQDHDFGPDEDLPARDEPEPDFRRETLRDLAGHHQEHAWIAMEFAADNVDRLIHVAGAGWFYWDGRRWAADVKDKRATCAVLEVVRRLAPDSLGHKARWRALESAQKASGIRSVLTLAAAQPGISVDISELDADPFAWEWTWGCSGPCGPRVPTKGRADARPMNPPERARGRGGGWVVLHLAARPRSAPLRPPACAPGRGSETGGPSGPAGRSRPAVGRTLLPWITGRTHRPPAERPGRPQRAPRPARPYLVGISPGCPLSSMARIRYSSHCGQGL